MANMTVRNLDFFILTSPFGFRDYFVQRLYDVILRDNVPLYTRIMYCFGLELHYKMTIQPPLRGQWQVKSQRSLWPKQSIGMEDSRLLIQAHVVLAIV